MGEIFEKVLAVRRVHDFGVKLRRPETAFFVRDDGVWCAVALRHNLEARRDFGHAVAMGHPDLFMRAFFPDVLRNGTVFDHVDIGAAEFAGVPAFNLAAELVHHHLLAIANAEDRKAEVIDIHRRMRRVRRVNAARAAGENDAFGIESANLSLFGLIEGPYFAINATLAQTSCDQLGNLRAEIEDENTVMLGE
jgi:hypothetical protein